MWQIPVQSYCWASLLIWKRRRRWRSRDGWHAIYINILCARLFHFSNSFYYSLSCIIKYLYICVGPLIKKMSCCAAKKRLAEQRNRAPQTFYTKIEEDQESLRAQREIQRARQNPSSRKIVIPATRAPLSHSIAAHASTPPINAALATATAPSGGEAKNERPPADFHGNSKVATDTINTTPNSHVLNTLDRLIQSGFSFRS